MAFELFEEDEQAVMPFIRFERRPVEDKAASAAAGHYVARDVDYALITPPYSKDVLIKKVDAWLAQLKADVSSKRIPQAWVDAQRKAYDYFTKGQELPLDGTPIKGWGMISPAQQETLVKMHVLTVEQLAAMNDEGVRRVGIGAIDLKNKASAWLKNIKKAGASTLEIAALKKENENLKADMLVLQEKMNALLAQQNSPASPVMSDDIINAAELMED